MFKGHIKYILRLKRCAAHLIALLWRERLQLSQKLRNFCQANEATATRVDLKRQFGLAAVGKNEVALIEREGDRLGEIVEGSA